MLSSYLQSRSHTRTGLLATILVLQSFLFLRSGVAMDLARVETRTDDAIARFGVTGKGVLVAIMDRGIDWRNNDFCNSNGTTRIKYIFDLTDDTGANAVGNTYGKGTIYTEAQINAALSGGPGLATRDAVGHGTTTAGIACGNGRNSVAQKYRGIAPDASIIIVKITSDGAPAHDDQPAEAAFYDPTRIPIAIDFVHDKAKELHMPCVMTLNIGSQGGPTDSSSSLCNKIDATVGPGIPGLIFVTSSGDDGGMTNHAGGQVTLNGTTSIQVMKGNAGVAYIDLWYSTRDRFNVAIQSPTASYGPYTAPSFFDMQQTPDFAYYHYGASANAYASTDNKREIFIELEGPTGVYTISLIGALIRIGRFDATLNPSQVWNTADNLNQFLNFGVPGSIWDGASALYTICAGDYVLRTNYTDIDGFPRFITDESVSNLWQGSSTGPTFDGRVGIDVCAPGDSVFASYATNSYWHTFRFNLIQDGAGLYGRASATSAADPIATGIVALLLQLNPQLDAPTVKSILQQSAHTDSYTGPTPNNNWGYGKVDAYNALILAAPHPQITAFDAAGNLAQVSFSTVTGMNYRVEYTDSLNPPSWTIMTNCLMGDGLKIITDPSVTNLPQRFYHAVMFP